MSRDGHVDLCSTDLRTTGSACRSYTGFLVLRESMNRGLDLRVPSDSLGYAGYAVCRP